MPQEPDMFEAQAATIRDIYLSRGQAKYGLEGISQLEHALQAAWLAEQQKEPPAFVLAALLHDVGHLTACMGDNPAAEGLDNRHEILGSDWLAARLPASVSEPVRLHVEAKRFLCTTVPGYLSSLASDSVVSLQLQGGPFSMAECEAFLRRPFARDAIRLRQIDDASKREDLETPQIDHFLRYLEKIKPDPVSNVAREEFRRRGFVVLRDFFSQAEIRELDSASAAFGKAAQELQGHARSEGVSLATLAQQLTQSLIVVPEAGNHDQICRFEYLLGSNPAFAQLLKSLVEPVINSLHGEPFLPFKDKENEKLPGSGAFRPHQDFAAYQAFGPRYNATAMISIDAQTIANGCVEFASNFEEIARNPSAVVDTFEGRPLLHHHVGGPMNGDIHEDVAQAIEWMPVELAPGDLVVFDSFVPHKSAANRTHRPRRAMFITYAPQRDGPWYDRYYDDKRRNYLDPKFHVSTPTHSMAGTDPA